MCKLCAIARGAAPAQPVLRASAVAVVVAARDPRAAVHRLVLPREHVLQEQLRAPGHRDLIRHLVALGREELEGLAVPPESGRFVFHAPPFNSEPHLHLHVLAGPFNNWYRDLAHRPGTPWAVDAAALLFGPAKTGPGPGGGVLGREPTHRAKRYFHWAWYS